MAKAKDKTSAKENAKANGNAEGQDRLLDDETMADLSVLSLDPGGEVPSKSVLILKQGKKTIGNELKRGQEVLLIVHGRVDEVDFKGDTRFHFIENVDMYEETSEEAAEALADEETAAIAAPDETEDKAEPVGEEDVLDLAAEGAESEIEGEEEVVDGEIIEEGGISDIEDPETAAMDEAAGDLEWT